VTAQAHPRYVPPGVVAEQAYPVITGVLHTDKGDFYMGQPKRLAEYRDGYVILTFFRDGGVTGTGQTFTLRNGESEITVRIPDPQPFHEFNRVTIEQPVSVAFAAVPS